MKMRKGSFRFPGQHFIEETGLYYNWWRWYKQKLGLYLQNEITIQLDNTIYIKNEINGYIYVRGNPLMLYDFSGRIALAHCYCSYMDHYLYEEYYNRGCTPSPPLFKGDPGYERCECECYYKLICVNGEVITYDEQTEKYEKKEGGIDIYTIPCACWVTPCDCK